MKSKIKIMTICWLIMLTTVGLVFGITRNPPEPRVYCFDESREAGTEFSVDTKVLDEEGNYGSWSLVVEYVNLPGWLTVSPQEVLVPENPNDVMVKRTLSGEIPRVVTTYEWMVRAIDRAGNDDNKWYRLEVTPDITPPFIKGIRFGK